MYEHKHRVLQIDPPKEQYIVQRRQYDDRPGGGSFWIDVEETRGYSLKDCKAYVDLRKPIQSRVVYEG